MTHMVAGNPERQQGFTLVEVLVAFVVMSLAVIAGFTLMANGLQRISVVEQRLAELAAAREAIESGSTVQRRQDVIVRKVILNERKPDWTNSQPVLVIAETAGGDGGLVLETIQIMALQSP